MSSRLQYIVIWCIIYYKMFAASLNKEEGTFTMQEFYINDRYLGELVKRTRGKDVGYMPDYQYERFLVEGGLSFIIPYGFYLEEIHHNSGCYIRLLNPAFLESYRENSPMQQLFIDGFYFDEVQKRTIHKDKGYMPDFTCWRFLLRCGMSVLIPLGCIKSEKLRGNGKEICIALYNSLFLY